MEMKYKVVDLTHDLSRDIPTWDGGCGFDLAVSKDYESFSGPDLFRVQEITCGAGSSTHMDAPAHIIPGGLTIDQLNLTDLVSDCVVIDVSDQADESYVAMPGSIEKFERQHGKIAPHSLVIFHTGWDKRWESREQYHNNHMFPSVHLSTAEMLLERSIVGIGIDTLSCDRGNNGFPVHQAILGAGKYLLENIANAGDLPPTGALVLALPMKLMDGTESPVRLIALI
ncbi:MAG: cyclase family protein [Chthoniobacterales bacterium]